MFQDESRKNCPELIYFVIKVFKIVMENPLFGFWKVKLESCGSYGDLYRTCDV